MKKFIKKILVLLLILFNIFPNIVFSKEKTPIVSKPTASKEQIVQWSKNRKASDTYIKSIDIIWEEAIKEEINPVLVSAQIALETNFMRSEVFKENYNPAGIKQTETAYKKFDTIRDGIRAEVKHLSLYAGKSGDKDSWLFGWCKYIEDLTGRWAEDPDYDEKILSMMNEIENTKIKKENKKEETKSKENILKTKKKKENSSLKNKLDEINKIHLERINSLRKKFNL